MSSGEDLGALDELHARLAQVREELGAEASPRFVGELFVERADGAITTRDGRVLRGPIPTFKIEKPKE